MAYQQGEHHQNPPHQEVKGKWFKERQKITEYLEKHNMTSQELEVAYQVALGIPESDEDIAPHFTKTVKELAQIIKKYTTEGFPLNDIAEMISNRSSLESSKDNFHTWLTELAITENEKKLLRSIVEERRTGTITFVDKKTGDDIFEFKIPKDESERSSTPVWAFNFDRFLKDAIAHSSGHGISIWFEAR